MIKWLLGALLLLAPSLALAQNQGQIVPSGSFTPGHTVRCQNSTCTVAVDGGGAAGSNKNGQGYLTELGITNTGTPFCINDALINAPGGYHQFCLGANALGGGLLSYNAVGGASPLGLTINLNGTNYPFPFAGGGNVIGPTSPSPTAGDLAIWNGGTALKDGGPIAYFDARAYGQDPTGVSDSTAAINACLTAAGAGNACLVTGRALVISGNITIPANGTLSCGNGFADVNDLTLWNTHPAIILDSAVSITQAANGGGTIKNCLIVLRGLTFPTANANAFGGNAINDNGQVSLTVKDTIILGFDSCLRISGSRPEVRHVWCDAQGASHPAIDVENGNNDSGHFTEIKVQPFATGNYGQFTTNCANVTRTGTGFESNGINFYDRIVSQNYQVAQFVLTSAGWANVLWADMPLQCNTTYPNSISVNTVNAAWVINQLVINSTGIGLWVNGPGSVSIGNLFLNTVGGDCIRIGSAGVAAGVTTIGSVSTNVFNTTTSAHNCGNNAGAPGGTGYALNYLDTTLASQVQINGGYINNVATTPYLNIPNTLLTTNWKISEALGSDLANPSSLYGTTTVGSCTGLGASGTCTLVANGTNNPFIGQILLSPAGGGTGNGGTATVTFPLSISFSSCSVSAHNGSVSWDQASSNTHSNAASPATLFIQWYNGAVALTAGQTYRLDYNCRGQ